MLHLSRFSFVRTTRRNGTAREICRSDLFRSDHSPVSSDTNFTLAARISEMISTIFRRREILLLRSVLLALVEEFVLNLTRIGYRTFQTAETQTHVSI